MLLRHALETIRGTHINDTEEIPVPLVIDNDYCNDLHIPYQQEAFDAVDSIIESLS